MAMAEKIKVFGSALDVLDGEDKVELKRAYISALRAERDLHPNYLDPFDAICTLDRGLFETGCEKAGRVPIETWLTPKPLCQDLSKVTSENYKAFLEGNGCRRYSEVAGNFVNEILPSPFAMIGVDHSQTGGIVQELSKQYGSEQISLVVLDAHLDMFDFDLLYKVQTRLLERAGQEVDLPKTLYKNNFYSCGNFLKHLLDEKAILPENLFVIGVADHPSQALEDERDPEVIRYLHAYVSLVEQGVKIIPRAEADAPDDGMSRVLSGIKTPYAYISVDMDVGAFSSTCAVRFLSTVGMEEKVMYRTIETIKDAMDHGKVRCLGFDLMELDVHFAGHLVRGVRDRSYDIASHIVRMLLPTLD
jgi:arginase family enzyme